VIVFFHERTLARRPTFRFPFLFIYRIILVFSKILKKFFIFSSPSPSPAVFRSVKRSDVPLKKISDFSSRKFQIGEKGRNSKSKDAVFRSFTPL